MLRTQTGGSQRRNLERYTRGTATHGLFNTSAKSGELKSFLRESTDNLPTSKMRLKKLETTSSDENNAKWGFSSKRSPPKSSPGKRIRVPPNAFYDGSGKKGEEDEVAV